MTVRVASQLPHTNIVASDISKIFYPTFQEQRKGFLNDRVGKEVTQFQWRVYDDIKQVPAGQVTTYADIARRLDTSPRAVGTALRINPFCPLVPCHRVVARDGALTGFSGQVGVGSAVDDKARLLREEGLEVVMDKTSSGYLISSSDMKARLWRG